MKGRTTRHLSDSDIHGYQGEAIETVEGHDNLGKANGCKENS